MARASPIHWNTLAVPMLLVLILAASALAHLAHPASFHDVLMDEGIYINRAINILQGQPFQNPPGWYAHPFFGWVFMALVFRAVGYPPWTVAQASEGPLACDPACAMVLVPRILAGLLAVVDTALVYGITRRLYGSRWAALAAAAFFAITPSTWFLSLVLLDSFFLFWILLALFLLLEGQASVSGRARLALHGASGFVAGLAFITKIPAVTFLPLFLLLLFPSLTRLPRRLLRRPSMAVPPGGPSAAAVWILTMVGAILIWVVYAIVVGEFQDLLQGVLWQGGRAATGGSGPGPPGDRWQQLYLYLTDPGGNYGYEMWAVDPVALVLGTVAIAYALLRRDWAIAALVLPYGLFLWYTLHKQFWFVGPLLPGISVALGRLVRDLHGWAAGVPEGSRHGARPRSTAADGGGRRRRRDLASATTAVLVLVLLGFQATQLATPVGSARASAQHGAMDYVLDHAPPGTVVIGSAAYDWILRHYRPDLVTMNYYQANFTYLAVGRPGQPLPYTTVVLRDGQGTTVYAANRVDGVHDLAVPPGVYLMKLSAGANALGSYTVDLTQGLNASVKVRPGSSQGDLTGNPTGSPGRLHVVVLQPPQPFWLIVDGVLATDAQAARAWLDAMGDRARPNALRALNWGANLAVAYNITDDVDVYRGSRADGTYTVAVPPGDYAVRAWTKGNAFLGVTTLKVTQDELVRLAPMRPPESQPSVAGAGPGVNLTVQVVDNVGRPSPWAWVEISRTHTIASFTSDGETVAIRRFDPASEGNTTAPPVESMVGAVPRGPAVDAPPVAAAVGQGPKRRIA